MAKEILSVPEEYLEYVISVIRAGLEVAYCPDEVKKQLNSWCEKEESYLDRLSSAEN